MITPFLLKMSKAAERAPEALACTNSNDKEFDDGAI